MTMPTSQDRTFTPPRDGLFPPGFSYSPPVESVCTLGHKHTNIDCPICSTHIAADLTRRFP